MKTPRPLPTRTLPKSPDLSHLKRQSKELLETLRASDPSIALHDAQFALARSYGFDSWPKLKAYVDGVNVVALTDAVRAGNVDEVRSILTMRPELVNVVLASNNEHRALHFAVLARNAVMVRLLMQLGADPRLGISPHNDATTALMIAWDREYSEITAILREEEKPRPPERVREEETPLTKDQTAVIEGDLEYLRVRYAEGAYAHPIDEDGGLLKLAAAYDRADVLRLLLDLGLDPDAKVRVESEGPEEIAYTWGSPLYECARNGKHELAEMLLEEGADPNGQVYASGTPLSEAFGQQDERMIALLEKFGGKPNPSMAGLYRRKDLAIRMLEQYGDERLPDDGFGSGTVAEQLIASAARGGDPEIMRMGMERVDWPDGDPRWYVALNLGFWNHWYGPWCHHEWDRTTYLQCFKMGLAKIGAPTRRQRFGLTLMHGIVMMGGHIHAEEKIAFAEAALDAGARLDLRDDLLLSTPLGWACRWGKEEFVRLFLDRGADPVEADAEPWARPLAWAEKKGHTSIVSLLQRC